MDKSFFPFCHNARVWQRDRQSDRRTDGHNFHRYLSHRDLSQWCPWWMHPAIIMRTVRVLWTWLWAHTTFHRSENTCLVSYYFFTVWLVAYVIQTRSLLSKIDERLLFCAASLLQWLICCLFLVRYIAVTC